MQCPFLEKLDIGAVKTSRCVVRRLRLATPARPVSSLSAAQLLPQKIQPQRRERRALLVVLAVAVAAGGGLVEMGVVAHRLQLRRHLAGVAGMDAVVAARSRDQNGRIAAARLGPVIGRDLP